MLEEKLAMTELEHLKICPPYLNSQEFMVSVAPKDELIVLYRTLPTGDGAYKYKYRQWSSLIPSLPDAQLKSYILTNYTKMDKRALNGNTIEV